LPGIASEEEKKRIVKEADKELLHVSDLTSQFGTSETVVYSDECIDEMSEEFLSNLDDDKSQSNVAKMETDADITDGKPPA